MFKLTNHSCLMSAHVHCSQREQHMLATNILGDGWPIKIISTCNEFQCMVNSTFNCRNALYRSLFNYSYLINLVCLLFVPLSLLLLLLFIAAHFMKTCFVFKSLSAMHTILMLHVLHCNTPQQLQIYGSSTYSNMSIPVHVTELYNNYVDTASALLSRAYA